MLIPASRIHVAAVVYSRTMHTFVHARSTMADKLKIRRLHIGEGPKADPLVDELLGSMSVPDVLNN